jgi:hypothetical protein
MLVKNSVRNLKKTQHFTITKNSLLMLFKETIAVYKENHKKPINTKRTVTDSYVNGTYCYHWALGG